MTNLVINNNYKSHYLAPREVRRLLAMALNIFENRSYWRMRKLLLYVCVYTRNSTVLLVIYIL
jgi:hypothetical protein